jgi:hypothetical protein
MSNGHKAYVQEWMRVIPTGGLGPIAVLTEGRQGSWINTARTIWAKWPESYSEKQKAIENLFEMAVATRGQQFSNIYLNVLSGYYANWSSSHAGLVPQKLNFSTSNGSVSPSGPGQGGDFAGLARDLNKYTYDLLSAEIGQGSNRLESVGPWGLVMMDHISPVADSQTGFASIDLVELIMMNNFKFDMTTDNSDSNPDPVPNPNPNSYNATYTNGGNAISFE